MNASPWTLIGWRNLGRHPRRTMLTALGLAVGYVACVFMVGWVGGILAQLVENATSLTGGQIEINDAEYRPDRSLYDTIGGRAGADVPSLLRAIEADEAVVAAAPRVYAGGLFGSATATTAGLMRGVDFERERALTRYLDDLVAGVPPVPGRNELLVGEELARQLEVTVGDDIVVFGSGADGSMANDLFSVAGVFRTGLLEFDGSTAVMPIGDLQALMVLSPARVHEIAVATSDPWTAAATAARLAGELDELAGGLAVSPWSALNPPLVEYVALGETMYWVIIVVVFAIALFGVANTMVMATFERRREFAVMLALGSTPWAIVRTVLFEALAIGISSFALAAVFVFPLMIWWRNAPPGLGWFFDDVTIMGALVVPDLRVEYNPTVWAWTAVALVVTAVLAALYPAARAARIPPADTLSGL